jgi:hypothetical protein
MLQNASKILKSSGLDFIVFILLQSVRPSKMPDPYVQLSLGKQQETTSIQYRTGDPVWEQGFTFLVNNPDSDTLHVKVRYRSCVSSNHISSHGLLGHDTT